MTQTDLTTYHQDIYNALIAYLDCIKRAPGVPDQAALARAQKGIEAGLIIRDELRRLLPPEELTVQVALLDVPRRGGY